MTRYEALRIIINAVGCKRIAEIGLLQGETMKYLLQNCPITHYLGVDRVVTSSVSSLACVDSRVEVVENSSLDAVVRVDDESLDLVFIDADHDYESVMEDIDNWYKKVKSGGIICGHDFGNPAHRGVEQAVREYFRIHFDVIPDPTYFWFARKK